MRNGKKHYEDSPITEIARSFSGDDDDPTNVNVPWKEDNQAWWDWYLTLADNAGAPVGPLVEGPPEIDAPRLADTALEKTLSEPYPLTTAQITFFKANGFIKLQEVVSPGAVLRLRTAIKERLEKTFGVSLDGAVESRFLSEEMVWLDDVTIRMFVLSPRIAGICARLLGVSGVRLYHDNLLSKEPGSGRTPWHYDDHHFPLETNDVVTAWIPGQQIPREMGPLAFARPIKAWELVRDVPFDKTNTSYDRHVAKIFRAHQIAVEDSPFSIGEVSFHHNLSFHTAGPNRTRKSRIVLANTYFADGARLVDQPTMVSGDWQKFLPGIGPGEVAKSPLNPICWTDCQDRTKMDAI